MSEEPTTKIYLVGSYEDKFIVDRAYLDRDKAIAYCDGRIATSRKNWWRVVEMPDGGDWIDAQSIHPAR